MEVKILDFDKRFSAVERKTGEYEVYFNFNGENRKIGYVKTLTEENVLGNIINDYTEVIRLWEKSKNRGGARLGAGRKPVNEELKKITISLRPSTIDKINSLAIKYELSQRLLIEKMVEKFIGE